MIYFALYIDDKVNCMRHAQLYQHSIKTFDALSARRYSKSYRMHRHHTSRGMQRVLQRNHGISYGQPRSTGDSTELYQIHYSTRYSTLYHTKRTHVEGQRQQ
eukprot:Lankesteria_metandrocarpae@DN1463_c0_g1_i1.p1